MIFLIYLLTKKFGIMVLKLKLREMLSPSVQCIHLKKEKKTESMSPVPLGEL